MRRPSTDKRHFIIAGVLIVIVAAALYWLLYNALPLPVQGSAQATTIDGLFQAHMILLSVLFALVVVVMLYAIVVFRKRGDDDDEGEHFEGNSMLEIAWTVIPLILVVIFSYIGWTTLRDVSAESPDELAVNVTGRQWSWTFDYPDTGAQAAELVLPVNRPVRLDMEAQDVLHAFWVPEFRVKKDLLPGQRTSLRFTPTVEGEFQVVCAEICGLSHYSMVTPVRVVSEAEYQAWMGETMAAQGLLPDVVQQSGTESNN